MSLSIVEIQKKKDHATMPTSKLPDCLRDDDYTRGSKTNAWRERGGETAVTIIRIGGMDGESAEINDRNGQRLHSIRQQAVDERHETSRGSRGERERRRRTGGRRKY